MKKKQVIILIGILVIGAASIVYNFTFNSKHRDIANEEATSTVSAQKLFTDFQNNEALATTKYLDQVIEIKGEITAIEEGELVLSNQIQVRFNGAVMPKVANEGSLTIKGRCVGYDELLEMVKIDQASIINK